MGLTNEDNPGRLMDGRRAESSTGMEMERRMVWRCVAMCVLASWLPSLPASADILIESYRDDRPADADRILGPLRDELDKAGVKVHPGDVIADAGEQLPLPGVSDPALGPSYPADPSGQVELGTNQVFRGDYDAGLATLEGVLKAAQQNPGLVVADTSSLTWLTKAYAAVAFAHLRNHHLDAATEAVAEQIRSFPENPIGRSVGPDVATLSEAVRKTLEGASHGTLRIIVSQPDVQIFLDEHARGNGRAVLKLANGSYRLLLVRAGIARRYPAVVLPGRTTDLAIDWDADAAFSATAQWIGFVWPRGQDDKTEVAVSRYVHGAPRNDVFVVSIVQRNARRFVTGEIFEKQTGALVRHKAILLGHDDDRCGRALARYLLKGDLSACLIDLPRETVEVTEDGHTPRDPYLVSGLVPLGLLAAGGALLVTGGVMIAIDEDPVPSAPPTIHNTGPTGAALAITGVVAGGVGAYLLWFRSPRKTSTPVAAVTRDTAYIGWLGRF